MNPQCEPHKAREEQGIGCDSEASGSLVPIPHVQSQSLNHAYNPWPWPLQEHLKVVPRDYKGIRWTHLNPHLCPSSPFEDNVLEIFFLSLAGEEVK